MTVVRRFGIEGASAATGPVAVVDTFRAYSTAAYLFGRGISRLVLSSTLEEARARSASMPGSVLCGEEAGRRPHDFDLGNSPGEVLAHDGLAERVVVQRTSAGTRCLLAAVNNGARPVFAASLVVASATARALESSPASTIVASGRGGTEPADEDEATADLIAALVQVHGIGADRGLAVVETTRFGRGAQQLRTAEWAHPDDLDLCLEIDAFPFAMRAVPRRDAVELEPVEI